MKTIKELKNSTYFNNQNEGNAYIAGFKDAIEGIFNDIVNSQFTSVESIEKYLQDLLIK